MFWVYYHNNDNFNWLVLHASASKQITNDSGTEIKLGIHFTIRAYLVLELDEMKLCLALRAVCRTSR